ncbi:hypothetical protein, partial [Xanthomonas translucens]|uniref:hypothetical protein n=1 Tax=Xanthomonas campestris pv. translucens TaxID=343 RepID=UPI001E494B2A
MGSSPTFGTRTYGSFGCRLFFARSVLDVLHRPATALRRLGRGDRIDTTASARGRRLSVHGGGEQGIYPLL